MHKPTIKRFVKQARYRRDSGDTVELSNGHWLVRIPKAFWPSELDCRTASRHEAQADWEPGIKCPDLDAVMPQPFGAEVNGQPAALTFRTEHGHRVILENAIRDFGDAYQLPSGFQVNRSYVDDLERLDFTIHEPQEPGKAMLLSWGGAAAGALMPVTPAGD